MTTGPLAARPILLLAALLSACGLGTEVGNGLKPSEDGKAPPTSGPSPAPSPSDSAANSGTGGTPVSTAPDKTQSNASTPAGGSTPTGPTTASSGATTPASAAAAMQLDFDLDILVASCASPFAQVFVSPLTLAEVASTANAPVSDVIHAGYAANTKLWTLSNDANAVLAIVAPSATPGSLAVTSNNQAGQPITTPAYTTCSAITVTSGVTIPAWSGIYTKSSVTLTSPGTGGGASVTTGLVWYTAIDTSGQVALERIEISGYGVGSGTQAFSGTTVVLAPEP